MNRTGRRKGRNTRCSIKSTTRTRINVDRKRALRHLEEESQRLTRLADIASSHEGRLDLEALESSGTIDEDDLDMLRSLTGGSRPEAADTAEKLRKLARDATKLRSAVERANLDESGTFRMTSTSGKDRTGRISHQSLAMLLMLNDIICEKESRWEHDGTSDRLPSIRITGRTGPSSVAMLQLASGNQAGTMAKLVGRSSNLTRVKDDMARLEHLLRLGSGELELLGVSSSTAAEWITYGEHAERANLEQINDRALEQDLETLEKVERIATEQIQDLHELRALVRSLENIEDEQDSTWVGRILPRKDTAGQKMRQTLAIHASAHRRNSIGADWERRMISGLIEEASFSSDPYTSILKAVGQHDMFLLAQATEDTLGSSLSAIKRTAGDVENRARVALEAADMRSLDDESAERLARQAKEALAECEGKVEEMRRKLEDAKASVSLRHEKTREAISDYIAFATKREADENGMTLEEVKEAKEILSRYATRQEDGTPSGGLYELLELHARYSESLVRTVGSSPALRMLADTETSGLPLRSTEDGAYYSDMQGSDTLAHVAEMLDREASIADAAARTTGRASESGRKLREAAKAAQTAQAALDRYLYI